MSLSAYFQSFFEKLQDFFVTPGETVCCIRCDYSARPFIKRAFLKMEEDAQFPHAFLFFESDFSEKHNYCQMLHDDFVTHAEKYREDFAKIGVKLEEILGRVPEEDPCRRFIDAVSDFSDQLPDSFGALIFILEPKEIHDDQSYIDTIFYLAENVSSPWVKFVVFDQREKGLFEGLEQRSSHFVTQTFRVDPQHMESLLVEALRDPFSHDPLPQHTLITLLANMVYGRGEYERALQFYDHAAKVCEAKGAHADLAMALYGRGNAQLSLGRLEQACADFQCAADLASASRMDTIALLAVTNLGTALYRLGESQIAEACFQAAREGFHQLNQPPAEAYVLDQLATLYKEHGHYKEARSALQEVEALYQGITSDIFRDLRETGLKDVRAKLHVLEQRIS